jgi:hypothetical protein
VSAGTVQKGDLLVDNFNNRANLRGTGSSIIDYRPSTGQTTTFATVPQNLAGCPGGLGLSTAMVMLSSGWVIVGSAPSMDGNYVIAENAHVRLAALANNDGAQILRRSYSYNEGADFVTERWPPWHQGIEYDAGLFFQAYQKDPRTGFVKLFDKISKIDALNQFTTHIGSAIFACPPGVAKGSYIGHSLFEAA